MISIVANAHASENEPFSANSFIWTVISKNCGVTRSMIADIAVIDLTNDVTNPDKNESLISGKVTDVNTLSVFAPMS